MPAQPVIRSYEAKIDDVRPDERAVISKIGGMAVDRHRTIISHRGISLDAYRSNPIVLHEHGRCPTRGTMPVGRNQWIKVDGDRLIAKTIFKDDPYSIELFNAYKDEWLRGWSINVISHEASPPTEEEVRAAPSLRRDCDLIYRRSELVEYSTTAMPSHRDALTLMVSRGIWIPEEAMVEAEKAASRTSVAIPAEIRTATVAGGLAGGGAAIKPAVKGEEQEEEETPADDEKPKEPEEPHARSADHASVISRRIRKRGGRFYVQSEDGKNLGDPAGYPTEEQAQHRLDQIEHEGEADAEGRAGCGPTMPQAKSLGAGRAAAAEVPDPPGKAHDPAGFRVVEKDGQWHIVDDRGNDRGSYPSRADAEANLATRIQKHRESTDGGDGYPGGPRTPEDCGRAAPDGGHLIAHDGHGGWVVRGIEGVAFESREAAERAYQLIQKPTRFSEEWEVVRRELERRDRQNTQMIVELFELEYLGRV